MFVLVRECRQVVIGAYVKFGKTHIKHLALVGEGFDGRKILVGGTVFTDRIWKAGGVQN